MQIAIFMLAAGCAAGVVTAVFYPRLAGDRQSELRPGDRRGTVRSDPGQSGARPGSNRKRSLEDVLREIEEKQRTRQEPSRR
jgi:hypothetical protein